MSNTRIVIGPRRGLGQAVRPACQEAGVFNQAIQEAVREKLARTGRTRLATECARLDPQFEQAMAEEGLGQVTKSGYSTEGGH